MRITFKARKHDLNVSSFALVFLLLFENLGEGDYLTYEDIKDAMAIPDNKLQRNLRSPACMKFKVLTGKKYPPGRDRGFALAQRRFLKISNIGARIESGEERKETQGRIEEERRYQTDVRICM